MVGFELEAWARQTLLPPLRARTRYGYFFCARTTSKQLIQSDLHWQSTTATWDRELHREDAAEDLAT